MTVRPLLLASYAALALGATFALAHDARADLGPPPVDNPDDDDDGGCAGGLASTLPLALPPLGLGIALAVRHSQRRQRGDR